MFDCERDFWNTFSNLYLMTKEMYIKAEEYDDEFCSIMQPIKEQRDALDHMVRSYGELIKSNNNNKDVLNEEQKKYVQKNFDKAIGHMYRAFYDTADILTIILREHIGNELKGHSYSKICSCWSDYESTRKQLVKITDQISKLRFKKEVKTSQSEQEKIFEEYKSIIDFL
ncbi:MAG: hypothetical protein K2I06_01550, partial [Ruminococcus sp.]|nr:hypothetical protein [Ruminococcus sp.]